MKRAYVMLAGLLLLGGEPEAGRADDEVDVSDMGESVSVLFSDVLDLLGKEKVHSQFDMLRQLKEYGVSYQHDLVAPLPLATRLTAEGQRRYAGLKLFDAIYAATFIQRKEVADTVQVIENIESSLDLRSHADLSGAFFKTLKEAAAEPEAVDVPTLLDQLANDYVHEVPAMLSSEETSAYLIEGLFGFSIEMGYVLDFFARQTGSDALQEDIRKRADTNWYYSMLDIFDAFHRRITDPAALLAAEERLSVIRHMVSLLEADRAGTLPPAEREARWSAISDRLAEVRNQMLAPAEP